MSLEILPCTAIKSNTTTQILCPLIGRVRMRVELGQMVSANQIVADLTCLDRHVLLALPENVDGQISALANHGRIMALGFGEPLLVVETAKFSGQEPPQAGAKDASDLVVAAPMDGLFYLSSSPNDPPFVNLGDVISPGQTLGLIEVMKCFYPLKFQGNTRARVTAIKAKTASPVTSGMSLFLLSLL